MRFRPRSIRTKLGLAFLIAVGSILAVQVYEAVHNCRRVEQEFRLCQLTAEAPLGSRQREAALVGATDSIQAELRDARTGLLLSGAVGLLGLTTALFIANRVVRGTRRLARAARAMAVGDYRRRISIRTGDELESLGESFNALGESLLKHEQTAKEQAEMLAGMLEAARAASTSLDAGECGRAIAKAVCDHLGASDAAVFRKDHTDGGVRVTAMSGARHGPDWKRLAAHSADSGDYLVVAEHDRGLDGRAEAILVGAPLVTGSETLGAIVARFGEGLSREDLRLGSLRADVLRAFAIHAAAAMTNAELYTMEATVAATLQRSLISEAPEQCRGLEFAGRYIPALEEASVGGDFYDVTPLPNGKVAVVIADVSGKGLDAAIHVAACKYMLKALVCAHPDDPAAVLGELNESINHCFHQDFFVTMFHAVIDPEKGSILFANAGHPPAFLISENGNMHSRLPSTGIPLGTGQACEYENQSVNAKPGDVLLLYTDGVTDAVKDGSRLDLEGLHRMVFESGRCTGTELVDRLIGKLSRDFDPSRKDDIALLAVSFPAVAAAAEAVGGRSGGAKRHITAGTR